MLQLFPDFGAGRVVMRRNIIRIGKLINVIPILVPRNPFRHFLIIIGMTLRHIRARHHFERTLFLRSLKRQLYPLPRL